MGLRNNLHLHSEELKKMFQVFWLRRFTEMKWLEKRHFGEKTRLDVK